MIVILSQFYKKSSSAPVQARRGLLQRGQEDATVSVGVDLGPWRLIRAAAYPSSRDLVVRSLVFRVPRTNSP